MQRLFPLINPVMPYAWGSPTLLCELLGLPFTGQPQAELWMGAHPKAPSELPKLGPLDRLVAHAPHQFVGPLFKRFPFLFKVLAIEAPLSLQAHPDTETARRGFECEAERPESERLFSDPYAKPELLLALTDFEGLVGFRAPAEIHGQLAALGLTATLPALDGPGGLRAWLTTLLDPHSRPLALIEQAKRAALARGRPEDRWLLRLAELHPQDPGVLAPLFLNLLRLKPGESFFVKPGVLHAYLSGVGLELMGASDNVLRGGLTPKRVDIPALMSVLSFEAEAPQKLEPVGRCHQAGALALWALCHAQAQLTVTQAPLIALALSGPATLQVGDTTLPLARGQSALICPGPDPLLAQGEALYLAGLSPQCWS